MCVLTEVLGDGPALELKLSAGAPLRRSLLSGLLRFSCSASVTCRRPNCCFCNRETPVRAVCVVAVSFFAKVLPKLKNHLSFLPSHACPAPRVALLVSGRHPCSLTGSVPASKKRRSDDRGPPLGACKRTRGFSLHSSAIVSPTRNVSTSRTASCRALGPHP